MFVPGCTSWTFTCLNHWLKEMFPQLRQLRLWRESIVNSLSNCLIFSNLHIRMFVSATDISTSMDLCPRLYKVTEDWSVVVTSKRVKWNVYWKNCYKFYQCILLQFSELYSDRTGNILWIVNKPKSFEVQTMGTHINTL